MGGIFMKKFLWENFYGGNFYEGISMRGIFL